MSYKYWGSVPWLVLVITDTEEEVGIAGYGTYLYYHKTLPDQLK